MVSLGCIGAFGELGPDSPKMHEEMGAFIKASGVVRLLAVGADSKNTVQAFGKERLFLKNNKI